ncbi:hypothetical protein FACUT_13800 [Fusarium acutatum]|uniref:Uncharacterized protein n=1 Tax=Fusarium acutatum TaxID=78861 RepID=A0A8H4J8I1_9HYPO|nr:hypothetical protein FACUT_13800 [Fusarium acutatum]
MTSFRSTEMSHRGSQRERSPPRRQPASYRLGSTQEGRNRAPSHAGAQDRLIKELKANFESQKTDIRNLSKRITEIDRKVEEQGGLIKTLKEENRILKQQLDLYVPRP